MNLGKNLAYILRHDPTSAGVTLDSEGWGNVVDIAKAINVTVEQITEVVAEDDKQRYIISGDKIRASQGHSIPVQIKFSVPEILPEVLFHGTTEKALKNIIDDSEGLKSMSRQYVHLSKDVATATIVASRRKNQKIALLTVDVKAAQKLGVQFFLSENEIWLSTPVPASCLTLI